MRKFEESSAQDVHQLRFAAYQALSQGAYQESANLFEKIAVWDHREFLSAAIANLKLQNWQRAESIIDSLSMIHWPYVTGNDVILQYRILETLRQNSELQLIPDNYLDGLKEQVETLGESTEMLDLQLALLCP